MMQMSKIGRIGVALALAGTVVLAACGCGGKQEAGTAPAAVDTLVLGAYTVPKDAYEKEILPAFQKMWKEKTGRDVKFEQSYVASGAQARAIIGGFEADVAALSLEGDVDKITEAGLITHDWHNRTWNGFITRSLVVIAYRSGNPKSINDWEDLTRPDIDVLCANPKTSGGAQWFVNAAYGAGLKLAEGNPAVNKEEFARDLLKRIARRIKVMDKSGRESVTTFERGIGDALMTYENEALLRQKDGVDFPFVIPPATILIENPVAIVDKNVDKHGTREIAEAFVQFLHTPDSQRSFARYGFRPADPEIMKEFTANYPEPPLLFAMDFLGGWTAVNTSLYGPEGIWNLVSREVALEQ